MNIRDWIYVQDHCEAIDLVLTKGQPGQIYNIAADNEMSNIEIVKKILKQLGKDQDLIAFVEDRPGHDIRYSLDSSRIHVRTRLETQTFFRKGAEGNRRLVRPQRTMVETVSNRTNPKPDTMEEK